MIFIQKIFVTAVKSQCKGTQLLDKKDWAQAVILVQARNGIWPQKTSHESSPFPESRT